MAEILGAANSATKFFLEVNQISIDNWTFKLFYKATTSILIVCSVVSSSKQFFGDPINCEAVSGQQLRVQHFATKFAQLGRKISRQRGVTKYSHNIYHSSISVSFTR